MTEDSIRYNRKQKDAFSRRHSLSLGHTRNITNNLEKENRLMEERLRELKTAMKFEKEERQRNGGGYWERGRRGTLTTYAADLINENHNNQYEPSKKKGVQVLKEEPLELPSHEDGPGTLRYLSRGNVTTGDESRDGTGGRCGQCECRTALLACIQCSEKYCSGCFASFHLKGALKHHSAVPIPHKVRPPVARSVQSNGTTPPVMSSGVGGVECCQSSLFTWKQSDSHPHLSLHGNEQRQHSDISIHTTSMLTLPHPAVTKVEQATCTAVDGGRQVVIATDHIKASPYSLSYVERLLLKQHRRSDIKQMPGFEEEEPTSSGESQALPPPLPFLPSVSSSVENINIFKEDGIDGQSDESSFRFSLGCVVNDDCMQSEAVEMDSGQVERVPLLEREAASRQRELAVLSILEVSDMDAWKIERQKRMSQGPSMEPGNYSCDASQTADMSNHVCRSVTSPPTDRCWTAQMTRPYPGTAEGSVCTPNQSRQPSHPHIHHSTPPTVRPAAALSTMSTSTGSALHHVTASNHPSLITHYHSGLSEVSRRTLNQSVRYCPFLEYFFTASTPPDTQSVGDAGDLLSSTRCPQKAAVKRRFKMSDKFYAMSPKSWRPEGSLPCSRQQSRSSFLLNTATDIRDCPLARQPKRPLSTGCLNTHSKVPHKDRLKPVKRSERLINSANIATTQAKDGCSSVDRNWTDPPPDSFQDKKCPRQVCLLNMDECSDLQENYFMPDILTCAESADGNQPNRLDLEFEDKTSSSMNADPTYDTDLFLFHEQTFGRQTPIGALDHGTQPWQTNGRFSRAIVVDGDDLSRYDWDPGLERRRQNLDDSHTLDMLGEDLVCHGRRQSDGGSSVCLGTAHLTESAQIALSSIRPDDLQLDLMDLKNDTVSVENELFESNDVTSCSDDSTSRHIDIESVRSLL